MKKNYLLISLSFLIIIVLTLLFGCQSIPQKGTSSTTPTPSGSATVLPLAKPESSPKNSSPYTKAALQNSITPFIQRGLNSIQNNTPLTQQLLIPKLMTNVIQCDYYAYIDFQKGIISQKEYLQVLGNTQKSISILTAAFNKVNHIVTQYPLKSSKIGLSYFETIGNQTNWNTKNSVILQEKIVLLANSIYSSRDLAMSMNQFELFGVYLAQSKLLSYNNDADISRITTNNFQLGWLTNNGYYSVNYVNALVKNK